jgi:hypothetical protein
MADRNRQQMQIDSTDEIRLRARTVALDRGFKSLTEFVYSALQKEDDPKLTKLITEFLETKRQRGRQPKEK